MITKKSALPLHTSCHTNVRNCAHNFAFKTIVFDTIIESIQLFVTILYDAFSVQLSVN